MTPFAALALYPIWAIALAVGFTALRLARRVNSGLVLLCFAMSAWVTGLILLESPGAAPWAERILPSGMLLAGAFVQAGAELSGRKDRRVVAFAWVASGAVALIGFVAPRELYGPGARGPGPLFWPIAGLSVIGTLAAKTWLFSIARAAPAGVERRRRFALFAANVFGALGGGGTIALHITGLAPAGIAAPFLGVAIVMAAYAVWRGEDARGRDLLAQGFTLAAVTAVLSAPAIVLFAAVLPWLVPGGVVLGAWGLLVVFLAAFPLDPLRQLIADRVIERLFSQPFAVRSMVDALERHETRAEQAERLAELGRVASAVAHEVRNPLGVILAEAKLLEREGASAESLAVIRGQVQRASRFVDDLLRYARPQPFTPREVEVTESLRAAVEAVGRVHGAAGRIRLEGAPVRIEADAEALVDVFTNLVTNAAIATDGREGASVRVVVKDTGTHVRIAVEDDGPGVPEAVAARLFEPFVTGRGRDAKHPGTGLGLALSRKLAERHGATIAHERPDRGGARFVVHWPKVPGKPA